MFWYEKSGNFWTKEEEALYIKIDLYLSETKTPFPRTQEEIQKGIVHWYNKERKDWTAEDVVWEMYANTCCMWIEDVYFKWKGEKYILEESLALYHFHDNTSDCTQFLSLLEMMDTPYFPDNLTLRQVLQQIKPEELDQWPYESEDNVESTSQQISND